MTCLSIISSKSFRIFFQVRARYSRIKLSSYGFLGCSSLAAMKEARQIRQSNSFRTSVQQPILARYLSNMLIERYSVFLLNFWSCCSFIRFIIALVLYFFDIIQASFFLPSLNVLKRCILKALFSFGSKQLNLIKVYLVSKSLSCWQFCCAYSAQLWLIKQFSSALLKF